MSSTPSSCTNECSVCLYEYDEGERAPRTLPCGHTACTQCLHKLAVDHKIVCPQDRQEFSIPVEDLPKREGLFKRPRTAEAEAEAEAVPVRGSAGEPRVCDVCADQHAASHFCETCKENMCTVIATAHQSSKATRAHTVVPLAAATTTAVPVAGKATVCSAHNVELTDYDVTCKMPVCVRCLSLEHHGHKCKTLQTAIEEARAEVAAKAEAWARRAEELREVSAKTAADMAQLDANRASCEDSVRKAFRELTDHLVDREKALLERVAEAHKTKSFSMFSHLDHVQSLTESLNRGVVDAKEALTMDGVGLLAAKVEIDKKMAVTSKTPLFVFPKEDAVLAVVSLQDSIHSSITKGIKLISRDSGVTISASTRGSYLRGWGETGSLPNQLHIPSGVALLDREVYVADHTNLHVKVFSDTGRLLRTFEAGTPYGIVIAKGTKEVFVSDFVNHHILVFDTSGTQLRKFGDGVLKQPTALALDPAGELLYVCDEKNARVAVFKAADGAFVRHWPVGNDHNGTRILSGTRGIAVSPSGDMVCVSEWCNRTESLNHRVQIFSPSGHLLRIIGGEAGTREGLFEVPLGLAFTLAGTLLVSDYGNARVQEIRLTDGAVVASWGAQERMRNPSGIAVSSTGEVFLCDATLGRVQVFL